MKINDGKLRQVLDILSVDFKKIWTGISGPAEESTLHCDLKVPEVGLGGGFGFCIRIKVR